MQPVKRCEVSVPIRRASATIFGGLLGAVILSGLNVAACGQEAKTAPHLSPPVRIEAADRPIDIEGGDWHERRQGAGLGRQPRNVKVTLPRIVTLRNPTRRQTNAFRFMVVARSSMAWESEKPSRALVRLRRSTAPMRAMRRRSTRGVGCQFVPSGNLREVCQGCKAAASAEGLASIHSN